MIAQIAPAFFLLLFLLLGVWLYRNPNKFAPDWAFIGQPPKDKTKLGRAFAGLIIFMSLFMMVNVIVEAFAESLAYPVSLILAPCATWLLLTRVLKKQDIAPVEGISKRRPWILLIAMGFGTALTIVQLMFARPHALIAWTVPAVAIVLAWIVVIRVWKRELAR